MAKFCPLFSGSSANSTYISTSKGSILVDAGASYKAIKTAIESIGENIDTLCAVAVTHDHTDHIKSLHTLLKKHKIPLIVSGDTAESLLASGKIPDGTKIITEPESQIANISVCRFATSHDSPGSGGYTFTLSDTTKIGVCTDLGVVTDTVRAAINGCNALLLESNHDIEMLKRGPYPPELKLRIMSDKGHLSNNACSAELVSLLKSGTTRFVLGHLSQHNNLPRVALSCAKAALMDVGAEEGVDYLLTAASPKDNGVIYL